MNTNKDKSTTDSEPDSFIKLMLLINEDLESGRTKNETIDKLIQLGLNKKNAEAFVNTVIAERTNQLPFIAKYLFISLLIFIILFFSAIQLFTQEALSSSTKYVFLLFIISMFIFATLPYKSGKALTYSRFGILSVFWLTAATLSGLLFLQNAWVEPSRLHHGTAFSTLISLMFHAFFSIGPFWFGIIFAIISALLLLVSSAVINNINNGIFYIND